jgi:hypothetical protein
VRNGGCEWNGIVSEVLIFIYIISGYFRQTSKYNLKCSGIHIRNSDSQLKYKDGSGLGQIEAVQNVPPDALTSVTPRIPFAHCFQQHADKWETAYKRPPTSDSEQLQNEEPDIQALRYTFLTARSKMYTGESEIEFQLQAQPILRCELCNKPFDKREAPLHLTPLWFCSGHPY